MRWVARLQDEGGHVAGERAVERVKDDGWQRSRDEWRRRVSLRKQQAEVLANGGPATDSSTRSGWREHNRAGIRCRLMRR